MVDTSIQVILLNNKPSIISFLFLNNFITIMILERHEIESL